MPERMIGANSRITSLQHEVASRTELLFVDWKLNNFCNFRCSYCRPQFHEGTLKGPSLDRVLRLVDQVALEYPTRAWKHFHFTGGEPTAYEPLDQVLRYVKERGFTASVITNGSKPISWWKGTKASLDEIFFTYHIEMTQRRHFDRVLQTVAESNALVHVNVTMLPRQFDECLSVANQIAVEFKNISVSLKPLIESNSTIYAYSQSQQDILKRWFKPSNGRQFTRRAKSQMILQYEDGGTELLPASRMISRGLTRFLGWQCNVGVETLSVSADGKIFRGNCRVGGQIGSLEFGIQLFPLDPIVCTKEACNCAGDICTEKRRIEVESTALKHREAPIIRLQPI